MKQLLVAAGLVDRVTDLFAVIAKWAVLLCAVISAGNAFMRYAFSYSSNGWLEIQWYLFAACVMLGASQVLRVNEHVRVDVLYGQYSGRVQAWVDFIGLLLFMLPSMAVMIYLLTSQQS